MLTRRLDTDSHDLVDAQLASGGGEVILLDAGDDWQSVAGRIEHAVIVDINFSSFKDGRGFTLASQIRNRLNYRGRLRATGDLIPDQAQFLKRVGFDEILPDRKDLDTDWARAMERFSVRYQPANDTAPTVPRQRARSLQRPTATTIDIAGLNTRYRELEPLDILRDAIGSVWNGRIAILSSFGAEAAVGLHLVSRIDPDTPVLFLDTGRHFAQTEQYRDDLVDRLGLTNVRVLTPDAEEVEQEDPDNRLWSRDNDACCALRKTRPLDKALTDYDALITGRKRFHGGDRLSLPVVEQVNGRIRVNPLANLSADEINVHFQRYDLPRHPLTDMGYTSIGCWTCTAPAREGGDIRSGRWVGQNKTECGIHLPQHVAAE